MATIRYRMSKFGTILLTPEQYTSKYLFLRIECVAQRALEYPNNRYIPAKNGWLYWLGMDADFFVTHVGYAQWYRQAWVLWEKPESLIGQSLCEGLNGLYLTIMTELAKKPNIPPLPPSVPPLEGIFSNIPRQLIPGTRTLTFSSFNDGDFDVILTWAQEPAVNQCKPSPEPIESIPPVEPVLPQPGPGIVSPPPQSALRPPSVPQGTPASGASLIPPGYPPGYQSSPPNSRTFKWRIGRTGDSYVSTCSPSGGSRVAQWPTPEGKFPPVFYGTPVATEQQLGVASAQSSQGSGCRTPGGRVLPGYQFLINGQVVDANDAMQTYQMSNFKIYDDNGQWELVTTQASGSQ